MLTPDHPPFRPNRWLGTQLLQTIAPLWLRGRRSKETALKYVVRLFDGDRIVIHDNRPSKWITGDRVAILLHGLAGDHRSPYMVRLSDRLRRHGIRTIRVDMRGFGDSTLISRSHIFAGCSEDLKSVVQFVRQLSPLSKISLVGFSLGANVVLKTLGEWGSQHPIEVDSAIAVSPPIDLNYTMNNLGKFGNRIYENYFMASLKAKLAHRRRHVKGLVDNGLNPVPDRLRSFDEQFTAPIWGFQDGTDYYYQSSAARVLKSVEVPTILLASQDDPVVPIEMIRAIPMSDHVDRVITRSGGHLGFISRGIKDPDRHWMDWRISQWIAAIDNV